MKSKSKTSKFTHQPVTGQAEPHPVPQPVIGRRKILKNLLTIPFFGVLGHTFYRKSQAESYEEQNLIDFMSGVYAGKMKFPDQDEVKGTLPSGKIKDRTFSKLILGGNLLNGWAHSRDLIYVSQLAKEYHTKERIFRTLEMAEKSGINTLLSHPIISSVINEYWKENIGKIQFISDCAGLLYDEKGAHPMEFESWLDLIREAIDSGATACYIQGETADYYFANDGSDKIAKALDLIRSAGIPAGIGAHQLETIQKAVEKGFNPDFWMKTLHHQNYWSARHTEWHDNKYCFNTEETISFMKELPQPWIAFKVMAAGAILPEDGFRFAFENGADFICAGMFDFQIVQDTNIALDILNDPNIKNRERPWRA